MRYRKILCTILIFSPLLALSQDDLNFPYKKGEKQLKADFLEFYAHNKKDNLATCENLTKDSAGIYFVQLQYSQEAKKIQVDIFGSNEKNDLTNVIINFFDHSLDQWKEKFLKKSRVIVPVVIVNTCPILPDTVWIDWLQFGRNHSMRSGNCFFVSPIYQQFFYTPPDKETGLKD